MRTLRFLLTTVALLAVLAVMGALVLLLVSGGQPVAFIQLQIVSFRLAGREAELNQPFSVDDQPRAFVIAPGDAPRTVAASLQEQGFIGDDALFVDYLRLQGWDTELDAGTHVINRAQTIPQIAAILIDSRLSAITFRIIEGWRLEQIAEAIDTLPLLTFSGADFLAVAGPGAASDPAFAARVGLPNGAGYEGFMAPNTYSLGADITAVGLRDLLANQFLAQTASLTVPPGGSLTTLFEAVTLASIVQREAVHLDEAPQIAGVYLNRLAIGMKLDADPTVQFPLGAAGAWWPRITQADYSGVISPYNTYLNIGLPPGPIANPRVEMIEAVLNPQLSDFYFFQAECNGSGYHRFARTFDEHLANSCF